MKNSTIVLFVLLIVVAVALYVIKRLYGRLRLVESRVEMQASVTTGSAQMQMGMPADEMDMARQMSESDMSFPAMRPVGLPHPPNGPAIITAGQAQRPGFLSVGPTVAAVSQPTPILPLPQSGRFYDSGEFHMVGHITRMRKSPRALPSTLPLYGQRLPSQARVSWVYAVLTADGRRLPVYSGKDIQDNGCMAAAGCQELESGDIVMVPHMDELEVWQVKMYSRI